MHSCVNDCLRGEAMKVTALKSEKVAGQMERTYLTAAIRKTLELSHRSRCYLINVLGRFLFAVDFVPFVVTSRTADGVWTARDAEVAPGIRVRRQAVGEVLKIGSIPHHSKAQAPA